MMRSGRDSPHWPFLSVQQQWIGDQQEYADDQQYDVLFDAQIASRLHEAEQGFDAADHLILHQEHVARYDATAPCCALRHAPAPAMSRRAVRCHRRSRRFFSRNEHELFANMSATSCNRSMRCSEPAATGATLSNGYC